jgi:hypothetical protein
MDRAARSATLDDVLHAMLIAIAALAADGIVAKRMPAAALVRIGRTWTPRAANQR